MRNILIVLCFTLVAMSSQAATLSLEVIDIVDFTAEIEAGDNRNHQVIIGALDGVFGTLSIDEASIFRATFLGAEAKDINFYVANGINVNGSGINVNSGSVTIGQSFEFDVSAGHINFGFNDTTTGVSASNIGDSINKIAYIVNDGSFIDAATGLPYAFLIGFNDSGAIDGDYDDYVIGVSAVPVPAALPLMASALGAFGIARRRNKAKAAK